MTAPKFSRGDTVYLNSTAAIGRLEGYRVSDVRQNSLGKWLYKVDFVQKPPQTRLIGDSFDGRVVHPTIFFNEADLLTLCQALDKAILSYNNKITRVQNKIDDFCEQQISNSNLSEPKFNIGDSVYSHASARIGFLERGIIHGIFENGIQSGSKRRRYEYRVRFDSPNSLKLLFRQEELLDFCESLPIVLNHLEQNQSKLINQRESLCDGS